MYGRNKDLGIYSDQTGKAIYKKIETIFSKHKMKNINDNQLGKRPRRAVVEIQARKSCLQGYDSAPKNCCF